MPLVTCWWVVWLINVFQYYVWVIQYHVDVNTAVYFLLLSGPGDWASKGKLISQKTAPSESQMRCLKQKMCMSQRRHLQNTGKQAACLIPKSWLHTWWGTKVLRGKILHDNVTLSVNNDSRHEKRYKFAEEFKPGPRGESQEYRGKGQKNGKKSWIKSTTRIHHEYWNLEKKSQTDVLKAKSLQMK